MTQLIVDFRNIAKAHNKKNYMFRVSQLAIIRPHFKKVIGEIFNCILGMKSQLS